MRRTALVSIAGAHPVKWMKPLLNLHPMLLLLYCRPRTSVAVTWRRATGLTGSVVLSRNQALDVDRDRNRSSTYVPLQQSRFNKHKGNRESVY